MSDEMPKGAERVTRNLDLLVDMDEPEALVLELFVVATARAAVSEGKRDIWRQVASRVEALGQKLKELNEPAVGNL